MSVVTILRTEEQEAPGQTQPTMTVQPQPSWPLPATLAPGAHLTWAEWVARMATQTASELEQAVR